MPEHRADLLSRLAATRPAGTGLRPRDLDAPLPLSYAQERMWFLEQLWPMTAAYTVPMPYRLQGRLDAEALANALNALIARHEILRTVFAEHDGEVAQRILPRFELPLPVEDITGPERDAELRSCLDEAAQRGFDLTQPPFAARLLRLGEREHALVLMLHHIIFDEWSEEVLMGDLAELYRARVRGDAPALEDLTYHYADYSREQREWMAGAECAAQLGYWRQRLDGLPESLSLPMDRPRSEFSSSDGAWMPVVLPQRISAAVRELSQAQRVTPFVVLLAACQVLLARLSGQTDIVVGTPISNRSTVETERLIGLLLNTLAIRADLSGEPTFREVVTRAGEAMLDAFAHRELPFDRLVQEVSPERSLGVSPIFQVMFTYHAAASGVLEWAGGLRVETLEFETQVAKFDLAVDVIDYGDHLVTTAGYRTELFDAATIAGILSEWQELVAGLLANPDATVDLTARPPKPVGSAAVAQVPRVAVAEGTVLPGRPEVERMLREVFEEVLGAAVAPDDSFFALGGHSLSAVRLCGQIRRRLHVKVPVEVVFQAPTVTALAAAICGEADLGDPLDPLVRLDARQDGPPVFFLPPATGIAWCYAGLSGMLPGFTGYGLQCLNPIPVPEQAAGHLGRLREVQPDGPYRLIGWSLGGIVAHEIAVRLTEAGQRVEFLALLDSYPLHTFDTQTRHSRADLLAMVGSQPPSGLDIERLFAVADGGLAAATAFTPRHFAGAALHLRASRGEGLPNLWDEYLAQPLEVHEVDCDHLGMLAPEAAQRIAAVILPRLCALNV